MLTDPISMLIYNTQWPWVLFVLFYMSLDVFVNSFFLLRRREFRQTLRSDPLLLIWPIFILAPVTAMFLYTSQVSFLIIRHVNKNNFVLKGRIQFAVIFIAIFISVTNAAISYFRYMKLDQGKSDLDRRFFTRSQHFYMLRILLFDFPLAFMTILTIIRILEQSIVIHRFLNNIIPTSNFMFPPDGMYGYRWIYEIILNYFILGVLLSFLPAIMLVREKNTVYSRVYKTGVIILELAIIFISSLLAFDFHIAIQTIHSHSLYQISAFITSDVNVLQNDSSAELLRQIVYLNLYDKISQLPNGFPIPRWLQSILGLRIVTYFIEIYPILPKKARESINISNFLHNLLPLRSANQQ